MNNLNIYIYIYLSWKNVLVSLAMNIIFPNYCYYYIKLYFVDDKHSFCSISRVIVSSLCGPSVCLLELMIVIQFAASIGAS